MKKMGRAPCCSKEGLHRGPWTSREDAILTSYIQTHGEGNWSSLPRKAGLLRCGKSCRLRWMNYLRPDIKRGNIGPEEEDLIIRLHRLLGNRWSLIAGRLPGRTDNEIKNYWNSHLSKKLKKQGIVLREATPRRKQTKATSHSKMQNGNGNSDDSGNHENTKIYTPKATRLTARTAMENNSEEEKVSSSDHEESGIDMINPEAEMASSDWSDHRGLLDTDYLFLDHLEFGGQILPVMHHDAVMLERIYDEYSQLLESELDMNLFAHHDY